MTRALEACLPRRTRLLALGDVLAIALVLAVSVGTFGRTAASEAPYQALLVGAVVLLCLHYFDLYETRVNAHPAEMALRLGQVVGTACVVLALLYYARPAWQLRRSGLIAGAGLAAVALAVNRRLFWFCNRSERLAQRVVLLGDGALADRLALEVAGRPECGVRIVSHLTQTHADAELIDCVTRVPVERVLLAACETESPLALETLIALRSRGVRVSDAAEAYEEITAQVALESLTLRWLLELDQAESRPWRFYHRVLTPIAAAFALVLLAPLLLLVALVVRLDSPGPAFFRQPRIGRGGRRFTLYKFRTMFCGGAPDATSRPAEIGDPRITRSGRWLRRCRLDELPQLINVLRGEVALVGPRPFVPEQEEPLAAAIPFYCYRWTVPPGLTGWAQIRRGYCASLQDNREKLACDLFYIRHRSFGLDVFILFQTIKILLLGRGAR